MTTISSALLGSHRVGNGLRTAFTTATPLGVMTREGYPHEGIPFPDGTVIHASKRHGAVVRTSLAEFTEGAAIQILWNLAISNPVIVRRRAEDALGAAYDLGLANCQHFVRYCQGSNVESPAIQRLAIGFAAVAAALGAKDPRVKAIALTMGVGAVLATARPWVGAGVGFMSGLTVITANL